MLEEGRTPTRVKALLEDLFRPEDIFDLSTVHLRVTGDIAKDVKDINHGFNNDLSYDTCRRGVSPFTVIGVSVATASRRCRIAECYTQTTNLTLSEVASADTSPGPIPTEYHGLVNLLHFYVGVLQTVVGERYGHYIEVRRIAAEIISQQHIFENLAAKQITSLLWQRFMDARHSFLPE
jgi:hypothetical protein